MLFSIITPSFKQLDWLRLCVASVRDQFRLSTLNSQPSTADPLSIEHIIQDGGSVGIEDFARENGAALYRDGRLDCAASSALPGYRLTIHSEPDAGMYDAINRGLKRAEGTLLAYLNSDEQYLPDTLVKVAALFKKNARAELVFGDVILVNESGEALGYRRVTRPHKIHTRLLHLGTLSCATFFRRAVIDEGFFFDPAWKAIGDAVWVESLLQAKKRSAILTEPLGTFAFTGHNLSESNKGSDGEHARWARLSGAPPAWLRLPALLHHRIGKLLSGAYRKRSLSYEIYRRGEPAHRHHFEASNLGHHWPSR